jgi:hypothetical protein
LIPLKISRPNRTSRKRSKNGEDGGTGVYMWEETVPRVMVANNLYGEFYDFYSYCSEYFGYTLVNIDLYNKPTRCTISLHFIELPHLYMIRIHL